MRPGPKTALALYLALIFLTLPLTPKLVRWSNAHLGRSAALLPAVIAVVAAAAVLAARLLRQPRPPFPWPHLALLGILLGGAAAWRLLASSPVGRVHLPEYGILSLLFFRALGGTWRAAWQAGLAAAAVGLLDEVVQLFVPNRVFDWWDVALNAAAALLGALVAAWWRWTSRGTSPPPEGARRAPL